MADEPTKGQKPPSPVVQAVRVYDAVWQLVGAVGLGVAVGYALDRHFGTSPWCLVAGAGLGIVTGFVAFFRAVLQQGKRSSQDRPP